MSQILDDYSDSFFYANESIKQMTSDKEFDHSLCVIQKVYTIEYNSCLMVPDYQLHWLDQIYNHVSYNKTAISPLINNTNNSGKRL